MWQGAVTAQLREVAHSKSFREIGDGYVDIVQLKNGHTALIVKELKKPLELKVFDEKHHQKVSRQIRPKFPLLDNIGSRIRTVFEIDGKLVFFFRNVEERTPILRRMIVDPANGQIVSEENIGDLRREMWGASPADFYIIKDPASDRYAVALANESDKFPDKRLVVIMFDGAHKEIARARYAPERDVYDMVSFTDLAFMGQDLYCMGYASKIRSKGKENVVVLEKLTAGENKFRHTELNFTLNKKIDQAIFRYNPVTKRIMLLTCMPDEDDWRIADIWLYHLDPRDPNEKVAEEILPTALQFKTEEKLGKKRKFNALPVDMFVNDDGSYILALETFTLASEWGIPVGHSYQGEPMLVLGDLGLLHYDAKNQPLKSWLIPKKHYLWTGKKRAFYHRQEEGYSTHFDREDQFKVFLRLRLQDTDYILLNDLAVNAEKIEKGKNKRIIGIAYCSAFIFPLGTNELPARQLLFGEGNGPDDLRVVVTPLSEYDAQHQVFVTLRRDARRSDEVHLVWMKP